MVQSLSQECLAVFGLGGRPRTRRPLHCFPLGSSPPMAEALSGKKEHTDLDPPHDNATLEDETTTSVERNVAEVEPLATPLVEEPPRSPSKIPEADIEALQKRLKLVEQRFSGEIQSVGLRAAIHHFVRCIDIFQETPG